jgi:hypothetical protein
LSPLTEGAGDMPPSVTTWLWKQENAWAEACDKLWTSWIWQALCVTGYLAIPHYSIRT